MKKILLIFEIGLIAFTSVNAQNVAINDNGAAPNSNAILDIDVSTNNMGLLIPRLTTAQRTAMALLAGDEGLTVYDTDTKSYWLWDGTQWVIFGMGKGWLLEGNAGTTAGTNFLGTTDAQALVFKTNNTERVRILNTGYVGIGTTAPAELLQLNGNIRGNQSGALRISTGSGYVDIGPKNTSWSHFYTDRARYYFNTGLTVDGGLIGSYNEDLQLQRAATTYLWLKSTEAVFNENSADYDFRIESNNNTNAFFVDAGNDAVGIMATPNNTSMLGSYINQIYDPIEIGNDGASGYQVAIGYYFGSDPSVLPEIDWYGYVGYYFGATRYAWYEMNSYDYYNISSRKEKHDIHPINKNDDLTALVMEDIDKIQPSFYRYNTEKDTFDGKDTKYKPQMHLGVIADESPDYILGETFDKVNIYGLTTMTLVGVKENRKEIKMIKNYLDNTSNNKTIQDFGTSVLTGTEKWISFSSDFSQKISETNLPVITVTSNNPSVQISVIEKSKNGFKIKTLSSVSNVSFDWIAMAKIQANPLKKSQDNTEFHIQPSLYNRLRIPDSEKKTMIEFYKTVKIKTKLTP